MLSSWTESVLLEVASMLSDGATPAEIAAEIGTTQAAVISKIDRTPELSRIIAAPPLDVEVQLPVEDEYEPAGFWKKEVVAEVAGLLRRGATASQIGAEIGISRNAVIGKVHRTPSLSKIGFARPGHSFASERNSPYRVAAIVRKAKAKAETTASKVARSSARPDGLAAKTDRLFDRDFVPPAQGEGKAFDLLCDGVPLVELKSGQCKWAVNDGATARDHLFCGKTTAESDRPYCQHHLFRSFGVGTPSERAAIAKAVHVADRAA